MLSPVALHDETKIARSRRIFLYNFAYQSDEIENPVRLKFDSKLAARRKATEDEDETPRDV